MPNALTNQQYYHGLNRRFQNRASLLSKLGFRYASNQGVAWFEKIDRVWRLRKISTGVLFHASNRAFFDHLRGI
jgi:hypothetical protein